MKQNYLNHDLASVNPVIDVLIQPYNATIIWLYDSQHQIQTEFKTLRYNVTLHEHAQFTFLLGLLYSSDVAIELYIHLQGQHSQAHVFGLYALGDEQKLVIKTYQNHHAAHTQSHVLLKGMLKDQAQADVQGLIVIDKTAIKAQASQENKNIVRSKQARVISVPSIEVLQHDVQCCHASAVGQFDEKQLWYLQSRGLQQSQSYQLLTTSFFGHVAQKFKNEKEFMEKVCAKMA